MNGDEWCTVIHDWLRAKSLLFLSEKNAMFRHKCRSFVWRVLLGNMRNVDYR